MGQVLKVLGSYAGTVTTGISVYKVPAATSTTISSILVCNNSGSAVTFRIWYDAAGSAAGTTGIAAPATTTGAYYFFDQELDANSTFSATLGITLGANNTVIVSSSSTSVSFNLFGAEIS